MRSQVAHRPLGYRLVPPSPQAEKATARQDQARQSGTGDGAGYPSYEAEIIFGLQHLTSRGKMLIVRPKARLFRVSSSKVRVIGAWCRRIGAPLTPTCIRARAGPNTSRAGSRTEHTWKNGRRSEPV